MGTEVKVMPNVRMKVMAKDSPNQHRQYTDEEKADIVENLMEQFGKKIVRLAFTYVKDQSKAEDIAQDVFIKCFTKLDQFKGESSLQSWVYRIAVNLCKDYLKSWHVRHLTYGDTLPIGKEESSEPTPEMNYLNKFEQKKLADTVLKLPIKYREPIILHYYESFSIAEMSELTGLNEGTLKTRLRRGRLKLKSLIESYEGSEF